MNKLLLLIAAALAIFIIGGCILAGVHDVGAGPNVSASVSPGEKPGRVPLHEMPANEIVAEFIRHDNNISGYSATVHTVGGSGYEDDEYRFFAERPDRFRAEYLRSAIHGNGTIIVANGTYLWQYHPDTGAAEPDLIEDPDNTFFARKDYPAIAARILGKHLSVMNGTEERDGRDTVIIEAEVTGFPTQYYPDLFRRIRVWIDDDTRMMTRMELVGYYNETVLAVDLRNTSTGPQFPREMFDFTPPPGTEISPTIADLVAPRNISSMRPAKERFGPAFMVPSYLPDGFTFRYCLHYRDSDGRDALVYSNGTEVLSFTQALLINEGSFGPCTGQEIAILIGNRTGTFCSAPGRNHIRWSQGNGTYDLDGALTKDELARVAQSLATPALLNFAPDEIKNPETIAETGLRDPSARRMVDSGGEILGVGMSVKRSTKTIAGGIFPALSIRYNGLLVDFQVDPVSQKSAGRTIQVPNGAMIDHEEDRTVVRYNGEVLFVFDPIEEGP